MLKIKEHLDTIKYWLFEISKHNDNTIKVTENLRMILLNLEIEEARINFLTGIRPIADELEKNINALNASTKNMVTNGRKALRGFFSEVEKYINDLEN